MAVTVAAIIFAGFAPTYYLKGLFGTPPLTGLLHLHGIVFTAWIALFVTQTTLVAAKRTHVHRRLGVAGGVLAVLVLAVGMAVAIWSVRRGFTPPGGPPPLVFFVIPFGDLVMFAALVGTGLYFRRRPDTHKRLMLLATVGILTPGIARLPIVSDGGLLAFIGLTDLFVVACLVYDRLTRGRVHPAMWWGGLAIVLSHPLRLAIAGTEPWLVFARWIAS